MSYSPGSGIIQIQQQMNLNGTINYFQYKYKGSKVKIGFGYDEQGHINQFQVPTYLNLNHKELLNILTKFLPVSNPVKTGWFDRNPLSVADFLAVAGAAPIGQILWTYRVPVNRKCMIEAVYANTVITAALGVAGYQSLSFVWYPASLAAGYTIGNRVSYSNVVNGETFYNLGQSILLQPQEQIRMVAVVSGNGGGVQISGGFKGTEFDA